MPCTRGAIAGADVFTDGDTYCAVERTDTSTTNRGFDLRVRPDGGRYLLDIPGCEARALIGGRRAAIRRLVVAAQLERALDSKTPQGFHVSRALAGASASGDARLTVFTTKSAGTPVSTPAKTRPSDPELSADRDELLQGTSARLEDALTSALSSSALLSSGLVWVEVTTGAARSVRLAGCVNNSRDKATAERVLRGLLVRTALDQAALTNDIIVDPWR
jgi:hypothetical protein